MVVKYGIVQIAQVVHHFLHAKQKQLVTQMQAELQRVLKRKIKFFKESYYLRKNVMRASEYICFLTQVQIVQELLVIFK